MINFFDQNQLLDLVNLEFFAPDKINKFFHLIKKIKFAFNYEIPFKNSYLIIYHKTMIKLDVLIF